MTGSRQEWINRRQTQPGGKSRDHFSIPRIQRVRRHDETAIRLLSEGREARLDSGQILGVHRRDRDPHGRRTSLGRVQKGYIGCNLLAVHDGHPADARRDLLEQFEPFPPIAVSKFWKPVILPPGCARFPPDRYRQDRDGTKTMGIVCVACFSAARPGLDQT